MTDLLVKETIKKSLPQVYEVFAPMNDEYVLRIRQYHDVVTNNGKYTPEYVAEYRQATKKAIKEIKANYLAKAKVVIERIKAAYTEAPEKVVLTKAADRMTMQLERNNNLLIWNAQLPVASVDGLRDLYVQHKDDEDFMTLLNVEFMKRKGDPDVLSLKAKIENPVDNGNFAELDKVEKALTFICTNDMYPTGITNGIENVKPRTVDRDLDAYPIFDGPTFRPVFQLPA